MMQYVKGIETPVIAEIEYEGGMIERYESDPAIANRISLCKKYKVIRILEE